MAEYKNSFYSSKYQESKPVITTDVSPIIYNNYLIYHRIKSNNSSANIFDVVKDDVCVGMYAGLNGAKKFIDEQQLHKNQNEKKQILNSEAKTQRNKR